MKKPDKQLSQIAADFGLTVGPISGNVWLLSVGIVESVQRNDVRAGLPVKEGL